MTSKGTQMASDDHKSETYQIFLYVDMIEFII